MSQSKQQPPEIIPPDYKNELTQFERQGLVDKVGADSVPPPPGSDTGMQSQNEFGGLTRREALGAGGGVGVGTLGVLWAVTRNPGYDRADTARDAGKVEINKEAMATPEAQEALAAVKEAFDDVQGLQKKFTADNQAQLTEDVEKFNINELRDSLNKLTFVAFTEDTQIKTDRIVRSIIQDLIELQEAVRLKQGAARSPKRVANSQRWLKQAGTDLARFIMYFSDDKVYSETLKKYAFLDKLK